MDEKNPVQFNQTTPVYNAPENKRGEGGGLGPIIGLVVIIGIILIGGIYYFSKTVNTESNDERNTEEAAQSDDTQSIQAEIDGLEDESIDNIGEDIF